ncbi:hypothetical protein BGZ58_002100 [Dissophora ornata]|nr:hypothetical protein BGZ58_002100 [Dissophora ornata]
MSEDRFKQLSLKHEPMKNIQTARVGKRTKDNVIRLPSPKSFNRYRTVKSPKIVAKPVTITTTALPQSNLTPGPSSDLYADGVSSIGEDTDS